ncbi:MAG: LysM peptidoglycan-binding domain-containing protein [Planctomycetota bacterium]
MQIHKSTHRFPEETSPAYSGAISAADRHGLNGLMQAPPVEVLSDDEIVPEVESELDERELALEAQAITRYWEQEAGAEEAEAELEAEVEADDVDDAPGAGAQPDFQSTRRESIGEVKSARTAATRGSTNGANVTWPGGSGSFANAGYSADHPFSEKRDLVLTKPTFKRALKAAGSVDRRRFMAAHMYRLLGVIALGLSLLLLLSGCMVPAQNDGFVIDGVQRSTSGGAESDIYGGPRVASGQAFVDGSRQSPAQIDPVRVVNNTPSSASPAPTTARPAAPAAASNTAAADTTVDSSSDVKVYIVQRGDGGMAIARRFYGSASAWSRIAAANNIGKNDPLKAGQKLVLPGLGEGSNATPADGGTTSRQASTEDISRVETSNANAATRGPLEEATKLIKSGELKEARRLLSNALYSLGSADEQTALDLLATLNRDLLATTGDNGDCELYTVQAGDNLTKIAQRFNVTWQSLMKLNRLTDPRKIACDQKLRVLKGQPSLVVVRSRGHLDLWLGDHFLKRYAIGLAPDTPSGRFTIRRKVDEPTWETLAAKDPRNPLGARLLDLGNPTTNIHGSPESASAPGVPGVMMRNADIEELFDIVQYATTVEIR